MEQHQCVRFHEKMGEEQQMLLFPFLDRFGFFSHRLSVGAFSIIKNDQSTWDKSEIGCSKFWEGQ